MSIADFLGVQEVPRDAARSICSAIAREIGGKNDELTPMVWDHGLNRECLLGELAAQVQEFGTSVAVVISSTNGGPLGFKKSALYRLVNPKHSIASGPGFERLVFFPVSISKILALEGADIVFVPKWASEQVFHPTRGPDKLYGDDFKQRSAWESLPANILLFCSLLSHHKLAMVSTHDLVAHIAGFEESFWPGVQEMANRTGNCLTAYFADLGRSSVETLILPFMASILLDLYAQPNAQAYSHQLRILIETITDYIDANGVWLAGSTIQRLEVFPQEYDPYMRLMLSKEDPQAIRKRAMTLLDAIAAKTTEHRAVV